MRMWELAAVLGLAQPPEPEQAHAANSQKYDHLRARVEGRTIENWGTSSFGQEQLMNLAAFQMGD